MHPAIRTSYESKRGCGYRTDPGALYLVSEGLIKPCGRLPLILETCPCCGGGIRPARGWTWVKPKALVDNALPLCFFPERRIPVPDCTACPLGGTVDRVGLIWVGHKFYPSHAAFTREALTMGVSRRIAAVPHGFEVGKTWVLLAHRKVRALPPENGGEPQYQAGVFHAFRPTRIEVIVTGDEPDEVIKGYLKRGLSPVKVIRADETMPLPEEHGSDD